MCSKITIHFSSLLVIAEKYRFKFNFFPILSLKNFGHVTVRPQTQFVQSIHNQPQYVQISALHVKWFLSYKQINKFSNQKLSFYRLLSVSIYDHMT